MKLWLWKNFVDGKPEYWAFDNPFPVFLDSYDPQTLGEPCGYAIFKESRNGRPDVADAEVLRQIKYQEGSTLDRIADAAETAEDFDAAIDAARKGEA
jgi:hypothetical protein